MLLARARSVRLSIASLFSFGVLLLTASLAYAATPGLPFTEDFSDTALRDDGLTNADWSTEEQAVFLAWADSRQLPRFSATGTNLGGNTESTWSVALGDVDGDGDLDLVAGNFGQTNKLYLNLGSGGFASAGIDVGSEIDRTASLALGDVDGDGDLDLVAGNTFETNKLYLNGGVDATGVFLGFAPSGIDVGSSDADNTQSVVLGDVDGDGSLDLVAGNQSETNKLYLNDGSGGFPATGINVGSETDDTSSVVLGDLDRDGDLDLVAGNFRETNKLYLNDGSGGFAATGTDVGGEADETRTVVLGDVDGDGDLDLVAGNSGQTNKLYLNDGSGGFVARTSVGFDTDRTFSVVLGDVDGDGDLDLVAGNDGQTNKLYLSAGSGGFDATGTNVGSEADSTRSAVLGDVDGDGDIDLVVGNRNQTIKLYVNDGRGGFALTGIEVGIETERTYSLALGDVDGDGDLDLVAGNFGATNMLYMNDGSGGFAATGTDVGGETDATYSLVLGDVDGDGDLDLVVGNSAQTNKLYLNGGIDNAGVFLGFAETGTDLGSEADGTRSVVLGDVDGDGDLDLVAGNTGFLEGQTNKLYLNDGSGGFASTGIDASSETDTTISVVLGDVDGDGDLDLVAGNTNSSGSINKLYLNDGSGGFDAAGIDVGSETDSTQSVVLGDVDGDGDLDLVAGNDGQTTKLYLNDGLGGFAATGIAVGSSETDGTLSVVLGDVDGDGDLDLVAGNNGETNKLYLNDSSGGFAATGADVGRETDKTRSVVLGDVDGDGDLDLVAGNTEFQTNKLYLYDDVLGGFDATGTNVGSEADSTWSVVLGDVDGDGDLDLVAGNNNQANKLYLNRGIDESGVFLGFAETSTNVGSETDFTFSLVLGDVDGDGDLDLVAGNNNQANKLYLNHGIDDAGVFLGFAETGIDVGSETDSTFSVVLGDVDGNGGLDLISGNNGATNKLYLNDGSGGFAAAGTNVGSDTDSTFSVVLGDVDGDGDLDLVAGNEFETSNKLYLNLGSGGFAETGTNVGETDTFSVVLGDVDGDGDLDLVAGNFFETNKLYLNDGSGGFAATGTNVGSETDSTYSVVLGDVDGDGDLDLLAGNDRQNNKLYRTVNFLSTGAVVSNTVNTGETVAGVTLTAADTVNTATTRHTGIDYFVSNNGGLKWHRTYPGNAFIFPSIGTDLRWKAELRTLSLARTPILSQVSLERFIVSDLSDLSLSRGTLSPTFARDITSYTADVANATTSITVTPTLADANATVTVDGIAVTSGQPSGAIALDVGDNTITVAVTGNTTKTTTVTVSRTATIGGTVTGLAPGNEVVLQNNGGDNLTRDANGGFSFATELADTSSYEVTVLIDPTAPNQTCEVANNIGMVDGANVTDIEVTCVTDQFTVGGTIAGLAGSGLVLRSNGVNLPIPDSATDFTFPALDDGTGYDVEVVSQPTELSQTCSVTNEIGTLAGMDVTNIEVTCITDRFTAGGTVSGLLGDQVVLQNNGGDQQVQTLNGGFSFSAQDDGTGYAVTVLIQPNSPIQFCSVTDDTRTGTLDGADVTTVTVNCVAAFTIGGTVSGLQLPGLVLELDDGSLLLFDQDGTYTFPAGLPDGAGYKVTTPALPKDHNCLVANSGGNIDQADVDDVDVTCSTDIEFADDFETLLETPVELN